MISDTGAPRSFLALGFGQIWQADIALDQFDPVPPSPHGPDITVSRVARLVDRAGGRPVNRGLLYTDGFRFGWHDEVTFDMFGGKQIEYLPGSKWRGELPASFFSTVAALTLAWRGFMPLHATAVELAGQIILLAGAPGAGKSTVSAELIQHGARLFSDDLTVLDCSGGDGPVTALRGRQTIRLHPSSALELNAHCSQVVPDDPRGKVLVWPTGRSQSERLPVTKLLLLGDGYGSVSSVELAPILPQLLFRPVWMNAFPEQQSYRLGLLRLAQHLCAQRIPRIAGFSAIDRSNRAAVVLAAIDSMTR